LAALPSTTRRTAPQPRTPQTSRSTSAASWCYHQYPAGAAFGGHEQSGVGRENHRMMLDHYSQTKCLLVSYDAEPMGLFQVHARVATTAGAGRDHARARALRAARG
jgi:hypothetical protein